MNLRKMICILLAMMLMTSVFPATALASKGRDTVDSKTVDEEKGPIYTIEIKNLELPKDGEGPDYNVSVPDDSGYYIYSDSENSSKKNGVIWSEIVSEMEAKILRPGEEVFEAEKIYNVSVTVAAEDGYWFPESENGAYEVTAYINGIPATVSGEYNKAREKFISISIAAVALKEYDLIVEGGAAYIDKSNMPTESQWDPVDSAPAGSYIRVESDEIEGWEFDHWEILEGNIDNFVDRYKAFFTMPEGDVRLRSYYKSLEGDRIVYFHGVILCFEDTPIASQSVVHGETAVEPEDPYQEGKVFLGWYTADGMKYDFSTPVTEEVRLTAKFVDVEQLHSVFFCFGNTPIASQDILHGETAVEPEDPYQEGKVFLGWYTADGIKYDFSTPVTKEIRLTAKFKCVTHTWGKGVVSKKATCTAPGTLKYTCKECGKTKTSTIYKASGVKLSTVAYAYNGKQKNPTVVVKDSRGKIISSTNYTIINPVGRKNVGKYTYTIKFKNQYTGTKKLTFKINPKGTSISKLTNARKAFTVKWKKQSEKMSASRITGYQIQYSTSKKFTNRKTITVTGYSSTSKKITKLSAKKTYYVRIRTYKTVNGTKYYSGWSTAKSVKTK